VPVAGCGGQSGSPLEKRGPSPEDVAAREQILHSQQWQQTLHDFNEWLSIQTLYDPQQVQQIKTRLAAGINRMTPAQMEWFLNDTQAKLKS